MKDRITIEGQAGVFGAYIARATSTAEIGEVLPPPNGSANSSEARTPGAAS
jgi:hypothetical protein